MSITFNIAHWIVRIVGIIQLILGLLFWTGDALNLISVHMLLGTLFVLALWLLSATAWQLGAPRGMVLGAAVLGLLVLLIGYGQLNMRPGGSQWVIQVVHLVLGLAAISIAEMIGGRLRRTRAAATAGQPG